MISGTAGPDSRSGQQLTRAGVDWDALKVPRYVALRALERISTPGAVTVDPYPALPSLTFFIPAGAAANWGMPRIAPSAWTWMTHVMLPPDHKGTPPGVYWLIRPSEGLTRACELRHALEAVGESTDCTMLRQPPARTHHRSAGHSLCSEPKP